MHLFVALLAKNACRYEILQCVVLAPKYLVVDQLREKYRT